MVRIGVEDVGRRGFLKGMLGAGAFVLSVRLMPAEALAAGSPEAMGASALKGPLSPNVWLAIDTDGSVYIIAHRSEMGSGSRTAVPLIAADELDADWKRVKIVQATGDEKYGDQDTDGSHSVRGSFGAMREAGATARLMLVRAAAKQWGVPESECSTDLHVVVHKVSGKKLAYGELATAAAKQNVPKKEELKLKAKSEWRYIGKGTSSYDLKDMVTGKAGYGIDGWQEGMLYANVAHPPVLGSTVKSVDDKATLAMKGVKQTATLDTFKPPLMFQALGGVAVIADNTWAAIEGKKKLKIEWNETDHKNYSSDEYRKEMEATSRKPAKVVREVGNVDAAFEKKWSKVLEAEYYAPMLAHASMEPPAALVNYKGGTATVCAAMYLKAALGEDGKPVAWLQRSTFPPIASTFDPSAQVADAGEIGLGWSDLPYAIPNHRAENGGAPAHVRIGWLRSVCNVFHAFAEHSFADELAHAAGKDPREYMLALLGPDRKIPKEELAKDYPNYDGDYAAYPIDIARFRRVVEIATEKAGWGTKKNGNGFGMGLALHRSFLTYVATVVQVEMGADRKVKIAKVDTAVDAGTIVNPEMARQQFEGAATFSTSLAFFGEITAKNGAIQQSNFDGYQMARMNNYPRETHVHLVESDAPPAGIGEPGVPPFTPALCNAIFAATGKRYRELPLAKAGLA